MEEECTELFRVFFRRFVHSDNCSGCCHFEAPAEKSLGRRHANVDIGPPMLDISDRRHAGFLSSFGMTIHRLSSCSF
jgi:hypothetical protein